ncbi:rhamnogalacturonate lyase [Opitutaceae bacterium TAV5]|nr:rhamnogalacturonate lyase [Opitutaceae bacterium TAV5]
MSFWRRLPSLAVGLLLATGEVSLLAAGPGTGENLGRGLVAVRTGDTEVYVGWRFLDTDPDDAGFNLYHSVSGGALVRLNDTPLVATTDWHGTLPEKAFSTGISWFVRPVSGGVEQPASAPFVLPAHAPVEPFLRIPLEIPPAGKIPAGESYTYAANDVSIGDLDGDGSYEFVVKWDPSNAKDNSQAGITGNVYLDGVTLAGRRLWRIDLGRNIRAGAHYTQFIVYDFDGDGRAELAVKTAPGTLDGRGRPVLLPGDRADADYRNEAGYILSGPEYLTVFDGLTGGALATVPWVVPRHPATRNPSPDQLKAVWGDGYGNRVDRFLAGLAWLDGERPSFIMARGYYTRTAVAAWDWRGGRLSRRWLFDTLGHPEFSRYAGQGNHQLSVADVDSDGRQEIVYGSMAINADGTGRYATGLGHGDALHVGKFDRTRPGLQVYAVHENIAGNGGTGTTFRDAATGEVLWSTPATRDVGRGVIMDIDPRHPGAEAWATNNGNIYSAAGEVIAQKPKKMPVNFGVWWDADPLRELLDGTTISKWDPVASRLSVLLDTSVWGAAANNGTKATPAFAGDILGDWREEVVWRNTGSTALLLFTTTLPAAGRLRTFLQDRQYRAALAGQNVGYNQPPHPSFFVGHGMENPQEPFVENTRKNEK